MDWKLGYKSSLHPIPIKSERKTGIFLSHLYNCTYILNIINGNLFFSLSFHNNKVFLTLNQCSLTVVNFISTLENLGPRVNDSWDSDPSENPAMSHLRCPKWIMDVAHNHSILSLIKPRTHLLFIYQLSWYVSFEQTKNCGCNE